MATATCTCGCSEVTLLTSAEEACGCGCECCQGRDLSRDEEVLELHHLRDSIDRRLEELGAD